MGKKHEQKQNELQTQGEVAILVANVHQSKRQGIWGYKQVREGR